MSYSCMAGRCGTCRCRVVEGEVLELPALGWRAVRIDTTFPLACIAAAHEHAESRPRGWVVLSV